MQSNIVIALFVLLILVSEYFLFVSQLYAYLVAQKENCAFNFVCSAGNIQYGTTFVQTLSLNLTARPLSPLLLPPTYVCNK